MIAQTEGEARAAVIGCGALLIAVAGALLLLAAWIVNRCVRAVV